MLAKKTSKNQITLPKAIASAFPDAEFFDVRIEEHKILLTPVQITPIGPTLEGIRAKMKKLGIPEKEAGEAVRWARSQKR